jgi:hypothetical protein
MVFYRLGIAFASQVSGIRSDSMEQLFTSRSRYGTESVRVFTAIPRHLQHRNAESVKRIIRTSGPANGSPNLEQYQLKEIFTDEQTITGQLLGQLQINPGCRGILVKVITGTVSGTTPTLQVQMQEQSISTDGFSTAYATTSATTIASNNIMRMLIYPGLSTNNVMSAGGASNIVFNGVCPRQFRLVYIPGGTTPSIQLAHVYLEYIP